MLANKVTNTKLIFRNINSALEQLSNCPEDQRNIILYTLKTINNEMCDRVVDLVKERELSKIIANEHPTTERI
jgi:hypothetical protein